MKIYQQIELEEAYQTIINGCKIRNRQYQQKLYKKYYSFGMSIGIRFVQTEGDAIKILNSSFLKVFDDISTLDQLSNYDSVLDFKSWFKSIIEEVAIDFMLSKKEVKGAQRNGNSVKIPASRNLPSRKSDNDPIYRQIFGAFLGVPSSSKRKRMRF
jgi:hypothetical protein